MGVSDKNRKVIWEDEPRVIDGIVLYPITMRNFSEWTESKSALLVRQSTLPASCMMVPYLQALFMIDISTEFSTGLMRRLITILALSMKVSVDNFRFFMDKEDQNKLTAIVVVTEDFSYRITPQNFDSIRQAIAEMNGEKLPDESENPELVEAERDIASQSGNELEYDEMTLISSVAAHYRLRVKEMADWSVREFNEAREAIERSKQHLLCAIGEFSGKTVTYKHGNPFPSWCLNKEKTGSAALESMADFAARAGMGTAIPGMPEGL